MASRTSSSSSIVSPRRRRRPIAAASGSASPHHSISMSPNRSAWSSSTRPCLNSSSTARKRTITSSRSTRSAVRRANVTRPSAGQLVDQLGHGVGDADADRGDVEQVDPRHRLGRERARWRRRAGAAGVTPASRSGTSSAKRSSGPTCRGTLRSAASASAPKHRDDVLERLALEQAGEQQVALLPQRQLVVEVDVGAAGQQAAGLQLDERGGDQQELGGHVEVERPASARSRPGRRRRCGPG